MLHLLILNKMKKILFAVAIAAFSCAFVSCDADSIDDGSLTNDTFATGGGSGGTIPTTPPPPPPSTGGGGRYSSTK